ncbi:hypothetical protein F5148DRAFT_822255 [Russula earlei]|uniref:Uncharacterized protein n=1 Tax=Russula earlei TaxID=71964 RepID=A0ACC0UBU0_9AGAM|nr:hypothetical protein F5148DRAFT_822255 [Russula earlei]
MITTTRHAPRTGEAWARFERRPTGPSPPPPPPCSFRPLVTNRGARPVRPRRGFSKRGAVGPDGAGGSIQGTRRPRPRQIPRCVGPVVDDPAACRVRVKEADRVTARRGVSCFGSSTNDQPQPRTTLGRPGRDMWSVCIFGSSHFTSVLRLPRVCLFDGQLSRQDLALSYDGGDVLDFPRRFRRGAIEERETLASVGGTESHEPARCMNPRRPYIQPYSGNNKGQRIAWFAADHPSPIMGYAHHPSSYV